MKINIGTTKGNLQNVEIDKPFSELNSGDIHKIIEEYPLAKISKPYQIIGWTPTPIEGKTATQQVEEQEAELLKAAKEKDIPKLPGQMIIMGAGGLGKRNWLREIWDQAKISPVLAVDIEHEPRPVRWHSAHITPQQIPREWIENIPQMVDTGRFQTERPNKSNIPKEYLNIPMMAVDVGLGEDFTVEAEFRKDKDGNIILMGASVVPKRTKKCASKYCNNPVESLIGFCKECEKEEMR